MAYTETDQANLANNPGMVDRIIARILRNAQLESKDLTLNKAGILAAMDLGGYSYNGATADAILASLKAYVDAVQA